MTHEQDPKQSSPQNAGSQRQQQNDANTKLVFKLLGGVVAMFAFAVFVLPPMYDVFCEITGLNGKTSNTAAQASQAVNQERLVKVQFIADTAQGMPWEFKPKVRSMTVHPGEMQRVDFYVRNPKSEKIVGQAIPSVSPARGTNYLKKTECFCFNNQPLEAGGETDMPLVFFIDPDLPEDINELTLAYKLYNITDKAEDNELAMN